MRRIVPLLVFVPALLVAGMVSTTADIPSSDLHFSKYLGFDVVELRGSTRLPDPGLPALPMVTVTVVIPPGARVSSVALTPLATEELPGRYDVVPVQRPRPLSATTEPDFVPPDPAAYAAAVPWPAGLGTDWQEGCAAGFRLAAVTFTPLAYVPAEGRLSLHTRVRVEVSYDDGALPEAVLAPLQAERARASLVGLAANAGDLERFSPRTRETDGARIDYLVVTDEALAAEFAPLVDYRRERGLRAELRTKEWIAGNYPGRDLPEKIRNMAHDYFENRGLSYLLLAGDTAVVPCRRIRVVVGEETADIPTDLYYGDFDYSWDSDGDGVFGELPEDTIDMYADVFVGRASVDDVSQARNFVSKVETYERNPATDYIKRALLPGGWLWQSVNYHGRIVNDSIAGVTPAGWTDVDLDCPPNDAWVVADSFDHGFAIFDPAAHGWEQGIAGEDGTTIYTTDQAGQQTNDRRFSIMTSLACTSGNFEVEDCLAEVAMNCSGGGCIAVVMNSRYGWGQPPSMGPSEKVCVRFYDFLLNRDEYILGPCHDRSRETYATSARWNSLWRWCYSQFNLFGDPALDVWTNTPPALVMSASDSVATGPRLLDVTVTKTGGVPVENVLVCAWKGDEVYATALTNAAGFTQVPIRPATAGTMRLTASVHNYLPAGKDMTVVAGTPQPMLVLVGAEVDDSGCPRANGILDPGETAGLALVVENTGTADAPDATVVLRALSPGASVTDSAAGFGTIRSGTTGRADGLSVAVAPDAYPGSLVEFAALVTAGANQWELAVGVQLGYPGRVTAELDTGACALSVTALGSIGYDRAAGRQGRGFRWPKTDTSSLYAASFAFGNSADYVADRFHGTSTFDADWSMLDSVRVMAPLWNTDQTLLALFSDRGHASPRDVTVYQRGLGIADEDFAVLVYDVVNDGDEPLTGAYAGVMADFDVKASDKFRDAARTDDGQRTAYMYNVISADRFCGVNLLYPPDLAHHLRCIDHRLYVIPDTAMTDNMKYRLLTGELGGAASTTTYNWSVSVSAGPFDLAPNGGRQRLAFGFVGAADSAGYLATCAESQQWFNDNVGILTPVLPAVPERAPVTVRPNPFARSLGIRFNAPVAGRVRVQAFNAAGRLVADVYEGTVEPGQALSWNAQGLAAGVYLLRVSGEGQDRYTRVTLVR